MSLQQTLLALVPLNAQPVTVGGARSPREIASLAAQLPPTAAVDAWLVACEGNDVVLVAMLGRLPGLDDLASFRRELQRTVLQATLLAACRTGIVLVRTAGQFPRATAATLAVAYQEVGDLCRRINTHLRDVVWVSDDGLHSFALGRSREPQAGIAGVWPAGRYTASDADIPLYAQLLAG